MYISFPTARAASSLVLALGTLLSPAAQALTFNVTWDSSVSSAPNGFVTAFDNALSFFTSTFSNPVTINLAVGWGEVGGQSLGGALGSSSTFYGTTDYSNVNSALSHVTSDTLPTSGTDTGSLSPSQTIAVTMADAKTLGLTRTSSNLDGYVGFNNSVTWAYGTNRAVAGAYDFLGIAEHEISEVMGRISFPNGVESVLDLYRYTATGVLDKTGTAAYFSTNGGVTIINTFNGNKNNGDLGDWAATSGDAYNYASGTNNLLAMSSGDIQAMQALGYTLATPVPEADVAGLMFAGFMLVLGLGRARRGA